MIAINLDGFANLLFPSNFYQVQAQALCQVPTIMQWLELLALRFDSAVAFLGFQLSASVHPQGQFDLVQKLLSDLAI